MRKDSTRGEPRAADIDGKRRSFLKTSVAASVAAPMVLASSKSGAQVAPLLPSPATTPWAEELPTQITPLTPLDSLTPAPTVMANTAGGEIGRVAHQRYDQLCVPGVGGTPLLYQLTAKENPNWVFNPAYPPQPIWGYAGNMDTVATSPGPTFFAKYGQSIIVRIRNELPADHTGFGSPEISTHLHNMHTPSESDGFAGDFYGPNAKGPTLTQTGSFNDHFYPNLYAGIDQFGGIGDPNEALGTLFYHDHAEGVTAPNVLKGLMGRYMIFDHVDTGDETTGLKLPSWPYDYPLSFSDKRFDANGRLFFDELNPEGVLGDKITVNGKIEPVLRVARRKYRFRLLNGGPTRFYEFYLQHKNRTTSYTYTIIANDGNLLPTSLPNQFKVRIAPAERADIIIDFSKFSLNTELFLVNQLVQIETRRPRDAEAPGTQLIKFIVDRDPPAVDKSVVPSVLRPLPALPTPAQIAALPVRRFVFSRTNGNWAVNNQFFNSLQPRVQVKRNSAEVWELVNPDNGWQHPIHIHFEEGRILSKTVGGVETAIPANEKGRKDVYVLGPLMSMKVFLRFRDFEGKYMMHCHNLTHEDHAMMLRWDIDPPAA